MAAVVAGDASTDDLGSSMASSITVARCKCNTSGRGQPGTRQAGTRREVYRYRPNSRPLGRWHGVGEMVGCIATHDGMRWTHVATAPAWAHNMCVQCSSHSRRVGRVLCSRSSGVCASHVRASQRRSTLYTLSVAAPPAAALRASAPQETSQLCIGGLW